MSAQQTPKGKAVADARAKRQKLILAVASVVLLAVLGFELPKLLSGGYTYHGNLPTTTAVSPSTPGSPLAAAPGSLPDTDRVVIEPGSGQLIAFGLFKSKDPFVQQLSTVPTGAEPASTTPASETPVSTTPSGVTTSASQPHTPPASSGLTPVTTGSSTVPFPAEDPLVSPFLVTTPTSSTPTPAKTTPAATTPATTTPATTTPATPATQSTAPTSASISSNGVCENVSVKGTFPGSEDIFRVLSIAKDGKSVKIGVVGGAYDSGQSAATLKLGVRLTLVNTADGTRYVLLLQARCSAATQPASGATTSTSATTPTSTVAAPGATSTATTPIVTDSLDTTPTPSG
jgi:hypothetical protein